MTGDFVIDAARYREMEDTGVDIEKLLIGRKGSRSEMKDIMTPYNGYLIVVMESPSGTWRVQVRRQDGSAIETSAGEYDAVTTDIESLSAGDAIALGKAMIDGVLGQNHQDAPTRH